MKDFDKNTLHPEASSLTAYCVRISYIYISLTHSHTHTYTLSQRSERSLSFANTSAHGHKRISKNHYWQTDAHASKTFGTHIQKTASHKDHQIREMGDKGRCTDKNRRPAGLESTPWERHDWDHDKHWTAPHRDRERGKVKRNKWMNERTNEWMNEWSLW